MSGITIKPKILFMTPYYPPNIGGVQNYVYNIAKDLHSGGWEIVVVTSGPNNKRVQIEHIEGVKIYRLPTLFVISNTPVHPFWYFQMRKIIKKEIPDLINAHAPVPFMADITAWASGSIPFILTYHSGTMKKGQAVTDTIISIYESFFLPYTGKKANMIICSSDYVRRSTMKNFYTKCVIINPAVDTSFFKPSERARDDKKAVLFVGRQANYELKGLYYLIDAMKDMPDATLTVIGEKMCIEQKNVRWLGVVDNHQLLNEFQESSVLVLPSLAETESFGMVIIEAMACKTPVIGTNVGGIPEVISDGEDGFIVHARNSKELATAIRTVLANPRLANAMGENGYNKVKTQFTWEAKTKQTRDIFSRFLSQSL